MLKRVLATTALAVFAFAGSASAQQSGPVYVVSYFDVAPSAQRDAMALARRFVTASRNDGGNLRLELLQRVGQPDQFALLEAWTDARARNEHANASQTRGFRDALAFMLSAPFDERPHAALVPGEARIAVLSKDAVFVLTHVDVPAAEKDKGIALGRQLVEASRKDAGALRLELLQQNSRQNHMTLVEVWKDAKAQAEHGVEPHTKQYREQLGPISGSLYDERLYKLLD